VFYSNNVSKTLSVSGISPGSSAQTIVSGNAFTPQAVRVDWLKRKVYWTNGANDRIERSNFNGTDRETILTGSKVQGLAINPTINKNTRVLYWSQWTSSPCIERAYITEQSGSSPSVSGRTTIVGSKLSEPLGLTIDYDQGRLYWADPGQGSVESVDLNGGNRLTVFKSSTDYPSDVAFFESKVIWVDPSGSVNSFSTTMSTATKQQVTLSGLGSNPSAIAFYHSSRQPALNTNECNDRNGGCSDTCVDTPSSYVCTCPTNFKLSNDSLSCEDIDECADENKCNQNCVNLYGDYECTCFSGYKWDSKRKACVVDKTKPQIILTNEDSLRRVYTDYTSYRYVSKARNLKNASAVDYHYERDEVYWSDTKEKTISKSSFLNKGTKKTILISNLGQVEGVAVDWINNSLYWSDRKNGTIMRAGLDGQNQKVILSGLGDPVSIALDPLNNKLYYGVWGSGSHIGQSSLDGSNVVSLISGVGQPTGLSIDFDKKRLYWGDISSKQIEYASLTGTGRTVVYTDTVGIQSVTVFEEEVHLIDSSLSQFCKVNKFTGAGRYCRQVSSGSKLRDMKVAHPLKQSGKGCPKGTYDVAKGCNKKCKCQYGDCDPKDGSCTCHPGYGGKYCDTDCGTGKYGANCDKTCFCKNGATCHKITGKCICKNGFRSYDCSEKCDPGTYGPNCQLCPCLNGGTCRNNGSCVCQSGYKGSLCDQACSSGFTGPGCTIRCGCLNGGTCRTSSTGVVSCVCPPGFNGSNCEKDIDECTLLGRSACGQVCVNQPGGYRCICLANYTLLADKWSCKANGDQLYILFAQGTDVRRIDVQGTTYRTVVSNLQNCTAVDFYYSEGDLYYLDEGAGIIGRAKLDGSESTSPTTIVSGIQKGGDLAVDWIHRKLYWTSAKSHSILQSDLDGTNQQTFLQLGSLDPGALVVDPIRGYIFWTDVGASNKRIERAYLNGTGRRAVVDSMLKVPLSLSLDFVDRRLFFADNGKIESINVDGTKQSVVTTRTINAFAISEVEQTVFWTDLTTKYIHRVNKYNGSDFVTIRPKANSQVYGLHIVHSVRQPLKEPEKDECALNKGGCQQFCQNTVGSFYCGCYPGYTLNSDKTTCTALPGCGPSNGGCSHGCKPLTTNTYQCTCPAGFVMLSNGKDCMDIDECENGTAGCSHTCTNTYGSYRCSCPPETTLASDLKTCEGCPIDNGGCQQVCVTAPGGKSFHCLCHDNYILVSGKTCRARGPQPYLLFSNDFDIRRLNFDGTGYKYVKRGLSRVYALDMHYTKGKIYYATQPAFEFFKEIREMDFSGANDRRILKDSKYVDDPEGLVVDWVSNKLYWADQDLKKVFRANLNGTNPEVVATNLTSPRGIAVDPYLKKLYFTDVGSNPAVYVCDLDGTNRRVLHNNNLDSPNALSIDFVENKLYWGDGDLRTVWYSELDGSNVKVGYIFLMYTISMTLQHVRI
jgi:sugar lactone lactonase YvrE